MSYYAYDIETLSNFFSVVFINIETNEVHSFYIIDSDVKVNMLKDLQDFLSNVTGLIGYNNLGFDSPILNMVYTSTNYDPSHARAIYHNAQMIIDDKYRSRSKSKWKELDLYKMNHFDSDAKRTSLKHLQFAMGYENVMDMPIHHGDTIYAKDIDLILEYNINDVKSTLEFYKKCIKQVQVRKTTGKKYGLDLLNDSEPSIAKKVFGTILSNELNISYDKLRNMRTVRDKVDLKDVIFDYIKFETPEFQVILDFFMSSSVTMLKGAFTDLDISRFSTIEYLNPKSIKRKKGVSKVKKLHTIFDGEEYVFGTGGIHSNLSGFEIEPEEDEMLVDVDVKSYYPNISIKNKLRPAHLPVKFCEVYGNIYDERGTYPKSDPSNYVLKIILNSAFGLSNDEHSYLYDPQFTCAITINGQLMLAMLIEKMVLKINARCIAANTDGATFLIKKKDYDELVSICKEWENLTKLTLEYENYNRMIFRNVNNYIWIGESYPKLKGEFELDKAWHKDFSQMIVYKALKEYYVNNIPVRKTIEECDNILDFCKEVRIRTGKLVNRTIIDNQIVDIELTKLTRYYVSNKGQKLIKILNPKVKPVTNQLDMVDVYGLDTTEKIVYRETMIEADAYTTVYNVHVPKDISAYDINYDYYINECNKVIRSIKKNKKQGNSIFKPKYVQTKLF